MSGAEEHDTHVHAEVEYLEYLRMGEEQDDDSTEFGEGNSGEDGGAHVDDGVVSAADTSSLGRNGKGTCDV